MFAILAVTAVLGACLAVATALLKGRLRDTVSNTGALLAHHHSHGVAEHPVLNVRNSALLRLPYAIPIAAGCLSVLLLTLAGGVSL